jgi:predicted MFS family arabinose efflux permease
MAAFVAIEQRHPRPLVRLGILRSRSVLHANVSGAVMFGGYVAFQFVVTLYVQNSLHWTPLQMALGFLPAGLVVVASAARMGSVLERFDSRRLIFVGLLAFVIGYALFLRVAPSMSYVNFLLPTMLLLGTGFALSFPSINAQATAGVAADEQGLASGLVNTSIQIGGAVVLAIISAIIGGNPHSKPGELIPGMAVSIAVVVGVSAIGLVLTAVVLGAGRKVSRHAAVEAPEAVAVQELGEPDGVLCEVC